MRSRVYLLEVTLPLFLRLSTDDWVMLNAFEQAVLFSPRRAFLSSSFHVG
jgi:hypothetical protein